MALKIDIHANARQAQAEMKDLSTALEKIDTALDRTGRNKEADQLVRQLRKVVEEAKDAERAVEQVGDATRFAARESRDLGDSADSFGRIKRGAQEVQQEVGQNLGEAVSSIRGDFSDLGQVGQDTLGGLAATVAGFGPGGILAGLGLAGAAVLWGNFVAGQEEATEKQEALNELAGQFADGFIESAGRVMSASSILSEYQSIATDPKRYQEAKDAAKEWGVETSMAMRAMSGDATALTLVQEGLNGRIDAANSSMSEAERNVGALGDSFSSLPADIKAGQDRLDLINGAMDVGRKQASDYAKGLYDMALATGVLTGETDDLGNKIVQLPGGKEIVIDANTQTAYEDLDAIENRKLSEKTQSVRFTLDDSAVRNYIPPRFSTTLDIRDRRVSESGGQWNGNGGR